MLNFNSFLSLPSLPSTLSSSIQQPLKKPKSNKADLDDDDLAFKAKQREVRSKTKRAAGKKEREKSFFPPLKRTFRSTSTSRPFLLNPHLPHLPIKKKQEAQALKALKEKAAQKGGFAKVKGSK